ncbi:SIMPL domain-containing protein [Methanolobus psychrotolerans]|uniref:SIMPL domain-containing protein n=1 Tax=Methanolobus psychrotolerans TaxID=1874706 RepID=UPI000B91608D|nr:SIMPL domain-containing protein [Methanolobus psychrotolerans]
MSQENLNNKLYYIVFALSIALVLMIAVLYASSQSAPGTENTLYMSGYAETKVVPDTATLSIGVIVQSATAKEASDENAILMSAVIKELKAIGLQDKNIQTSYISVYPVYNYDGKQTIEGYSASNSVQVTTMMLDNLSDIIDRSAAAGANQIGSVSFSVSDEMQKELRDELINEAVADASSKADMLANSLGVEIIGVQNTAMSDSSSSRIYYSMPEAAMDDSGVSTPIQPGESIVSMSVQVTYIIN